MNETHQKEIVQPLDVAARDDRAPEPIPPEHLDAVRDGLAQAKRRQFASRERVQAVVRRLRP